MTAGARICTDSHLCQKRSRASKSMSSWRLIIHEGERNGATTRDTQVRRSFCRAPPPPLSALVSDAGLILFKPQPCAPACAHGRHAPPRPRSCSGPECTPGARAWSSLERAERRETEQLRAQLLSILNAFDESSARAMLCPCLGEGPQRATGTSARSFALHTLAQGSGSAGAGYSEAWPKSKTA